MDIFVLYVLNEFLQIHLSISIKWIAWIWIAASEKILNS